MVLCLRCVAAFRTGRYFMTSDANPTPEVPSVAKAEADAASVPAETGASGSNEGLEAVATEAVADSPEDAPEEDKPLEPQEMDRYECRSCGYSYEPTKGDGRASIPAGVPFEELPINWRCPVCSAPKKRFSNIGPAGSPSGFKENLDYGLGVNRLTPGQKNILIFSGLALGVLFFLSLYGLR